MIITSDKTKSLWVAYLSFSSVYIYTGVYYAGQNDIMLLLFGTMSVYFLLKEKIWLFYLFAACSVAIKPFFLFVYVALILLTEKSIPKAFLKVLLSFSVLFFFKLLFMNAPQYEESLKSGPMLWVVKNTFFQGMDLTLSKASYFAIGLVFIYFICYIKVFKNKQELNKYIIYMSAAPFLMFALFAGYEYYRTILLVPFLYLLIIQNMHVFRLNIILDIMMSSMCTLLVILRTPSSYTSKHMSGTIIEHLIEKTTFGQRKYLSLYDFLSRKSVDAITPIFCGLFVACGLLLLIINYPGFNPKNILTSNKCERWIIWIRMIEVVPFIASAFFCYFWLK
jgi:hypothetical protein